MFIVENNDIDEKLNDDDAMNVYVCKNVRII